MGRGRKRLDKHLNTLYYEDITVFFLFIPMNKHLPTISYNTIQHKYQRYDTAGDYYSIGDLDFYRISNLPQGWRAELAVFVHEIVEFQLCKEAKIKEKDITKFDIESGLDDPGASKDAPYHSQHMLATEIEYFLVEKLGLNKKEYDDQFNKLKYKKQ